LGADKRFAQGAYFAAGCALADATAVQLILQ
jgi:hypothetical protein